MKFLKRVFLLSLTFLLMSSLLLAAVFLINDNTRSGDKSSFLGETSRLTKPSGTKPSGTKPSDAKPGDTKPPETATSDGVTLNVSEIKDTGLLRLVSSRYATKVVKSSRLASTANGKYRLRQDILADVDAFLAYAKKADSGLYFTSAFRTIEEQAQIYRETANKGLVQKPGFSEHHTGLALDLVPIKALDGFKGKDLLKEQQFMADHSWKFGLIKRYPAGKEAVTGIDHEFWHFRYVGQPHAAYIHQNKLVLEEYLKLLQSKGQLTVTHQDQTYVVYYRKAADGKITFPKGSDFEISSTNTGAWIITVLKK